MRILTFILAVYIIVLNAMPCDDGEAVGSNENVEISQSLDFDHQNSDSDLCPPFCQCRCCHIHTIYFNLSEITVSSFEISTKVFLYFDSLGKDFSTSILQPPQV
jgi:hypothetical protein